MFIEKLISPNQLVGDLPLTEALQKQVASHRAEVNSIMNNKDPRKLVVVGPCSIHDPKAAIEYGKLLVEAQKKFPNLLLVMRVYFEKPRTTVGWKGYINDPDLDGSFKINKGLLKARSLCIRLLELGLPLATEVLDPFTIKYLTGIFSWVAIGARTTESQTHREIASGLPMCVGFKNGTNGSVKVATDAMLSAAFPHCYMGMDQDGSVAVIHAEGNKNSHIVLRGGSDGPNYGFSDVEQTINSAVKAGVNPSIMVDVSHANAQGHFINQHHVCEQVSKNNAVRGIMIESNINEGNQKISSNMAYGVSITDACVNFGTTVMMLDTLNESVK